MINWTLRIKNKVTLTAIIAAAIRIVYTILSWCNVVPPVGEEEVLYVLDLVIGILVLLGVVTDPTTAGFSDSPRAMIYDEPISGFDSLTTIEEETEDFDEDEDEY